MVTRSIPDDLRRLDLATLGRYGPIIGLIGLYVVFTALNSRFLTLGNQVNVLRQVSIIGILAVGVTFPIICAEIDLSIAEMMEFTGLFVAALATGSVVVSRDSSAARRSAKAGWISSSRVNASASRICSRVEPLAPA